MIAQACIWSPNYLVVVDDSALHLSGAISQLHIFCKQHTDVEYLVSVIGRIPNGIEESFSRQSKCILLVPNIPDAINISVQVLLKGILAI